MLKPFKKKKEEEDSQKEKSIVVEGQEAKVEETISRISAKEGKRSVRRIISQVGDEMKEVEAESLRYLKFLEEGRCPECGWEIVQFLFTSVCSHCGWSSYISPQKGRTKVHLVTGDVIDCQDAFDTKREYVLCVTDDVVKTRILRDKVSFIEYSWSEEEIQEKKVQKEREKEEVCDWCMKKAPREEMEPQYVGFGARQERYFFCSEECKFAFQKQYPTRVHRNCYEKDCNTECDECLKVYLPEIPKAEKA
jgi:hypothetical protein